MTSTKMYALVRWIGGEDDKNYTAGIPIDWIKGFNVDDFKSEDFDESVSYVVEWHTSKKPPGGWPVYDAYVIEVSNRVSALEKLLSAIDGIKSPTKVLTCSKPKDDLTNGGNTGAVGDPAKDQNTETVAPPEDPRQKNLEVKRGDNAKKQNTVDADRAGCSKDNNCLLNSTASKYQANYQNKSSKKKRLPSDTNSDTETEEVQSVLSGVQPLSGKRSRTKLYQDDPNDPKSFGKTLMAIQRELKKMRKRKSRDHRDDCYSSSSSDDEMVNRLSNFYIEIGARESGVYVTDDQWKAAKAARSYTAMGLILLLACFPMDVLLHSNLRGGISKIGGKENTQAKYKALDSKIIDAIYCSVRRRWKSYSKAGLGMAINSKLTYLRSEQKKKE